MPVQISHEEKDGYLEVIVIGVLDSGDDVSRIAWHIVNNAKHLKYKRIILNVLGIIDKTDMLDVNALSESSPMKKAVSSGIRVAALSSRDNMLNAKAYETSLRNRSLNYRTFTDREEAITWLTA